MSLPIGEAARGRRVISVGVDLVEVQRVRRANERTSGFAKRVFTDAERRRAEAARDPGERLAVRWAAKEAVLKALGVGLGAVPFTDIEVVTATSGAPSLVLHGAARRLAGELGIDDWLVSLTHTSALAEAIVVGVAPLERA